MRRAVKVLLVNKFFYRRGGAEVVFFNTADLLRRAGHDVVTFSMEHPLNEPSPYERFFVENVDFPTLRGAPSLLRSGLRAIWSREAYRKISALVACERPDVAHIHNYYFHLTPSILYALRRSGVPVVHTLHDYHLACPNHIFYDYRRDTVCEDCRRHGFYRVVTRGCMRVGRLASLIACFEAAIYNRLGTYRRLVARYIAPSEFLRSKMSPWPLPAEKIAVLPNPVEDWGGGLGDPPAGGAFFYAGRLSREKGLDLVVEVARRLKATRWRLAGTGPLEGEIRSAAAGGEAGRIELLGALGPERLKEEYRRASVVVLPSRCYENCPLTVLEAMSAGRPVIGARIGGIAELVREGETGWLFEPGDAGDFERVVSEALSRPGEILRRGRAARRIFTERYGPARHLGRLLEIYEGVVRAAARP